MGIHSVQIILLLLCLVLSAYIAAAEFALITLSKIRLMEMVENGEKNAKLIEKLLKNPKKLTVTLKLIGKFFQFGAVAITSYFAIGLIHNDFLGILIGTILITIFSLIFCEIIPKSLASQYADKLAKMVVKPINIIVKIFTPLEILISKISSFFIGLVGGDGNKIGPTVTESEIMTMVNLGQEEGHIELKETDMIGNVFSFGDFRAKDIMVPRTDMVAISIDEEFKNIVEIFTEEGYSRLPVYEDTPDTIEGVLYLKDIAFMEDKDFDIRKVIRTPLYTYELKSALELFTIMQENSISMAIVLDEYGGTAGVVTIEDFIEEIVGEIEDEYDKDEEDDIIIIKEDEYIVDGSVRIDEVNDMLGTRLESEDYDSIGGYILGELGRMPKEGEKIETDSATFIIESLDKNRIEKIRIYT